MRGTLPKKRLFIHLAEHASFSILVYSILTTLEACLKPTCSGICRYPAGT